MNKRLARRRAYWLAAGLLEGEIGKGRWIGINENEAADKAVEREVEWIIARLAQRGEAPPIGSAELSERGR